ncbi:MAG: Tol-Pal system beta propeller repeat protein TolB [Desulfosarcinaceae bacterium]
MATPPSTHAQVKFYDLTNPFLRKIPLAVPVFRAMTPVPAEAQQVTAIADQVEAMLDFTGYFKILDRGSFLYDAQATGITEKELNFGNWTTIGAELLVTGGVQVIGNELVLELRLFDTFKSKRLVGRSYRATLADSRNMVRRFCGEVMQALTGRPGMFDSRLAFVSNGSGHKEIYTCDFDGSHVQQLTKKGSITSFPAWSSDGRHMAFTSFSNGPAQIFIRDMANGLEKRLTFKGVQIAPNWHPEQFEFAATLSHGRDEEIYLLTGGGKIIKRLTNSRGIDVEPTWSPDGKRFAFVSNRAGTPQIYIREVNSGRVTRLTFEGQYNTQPSWSPKGDRIAYSSMQEGQINIIVIDTEGNNPIQLTQDQRDNEAPSWSPDGSLIAFSSTREGSSRVYVMTAYGTDQRRLLSLPGEQSQPKWSPNMPQ